MSITSREKKIIFIALLIVIPYVYFILLYPMLKEPVETKKARIQTLKDEINRYNITISRYEAIKPKLKQIEKKYNELVEVIPPNMNYLFGVYDLVRLLNEVKVKSLNYMFDGEQKVTTEDSKEDFYPYFISTRQTWKCKYADFRKLLAVQKKFKPLFLVDNLTFSKNDKNELSIDFSILFFGYKDLNSPQRVFDKKKFIKVAPEKKGDIFN